jgi:phosphoribosyl 1,2-cyclic phosphodiesterase
MKIRIWGCRGSLPTPGEHTVKYGGNTTCVEVRFDDGTLIILDAGSGIRVLGRTLLEEPALTEIHLFLTHAHWDHLMGFPFFKPAYSDRYAIHVHGGPQPKQSLRRYLMQQMEAPYFPVPFTAMRARFDFTTGRPKIRTVSSAEIIPVPLSHPNGGSGFKIVEGGSTFVFMPDNELDMVHEGGLTLEAYAEFCAGADLLLHDAQYSDEEYRATACWGHSRLSSVVELGRRAGVRRLGLFHHDPEHTDEVVDGFVAFCREKLGQVGSPVDCFGAQEGMELTI